MPLYDYQCDCGHSETQFHSMKDVPLGSQECPSCHATSLNKMISLPSRVSTSKNFKTLGQQAEANDKKMGRELKQLTVQADKDRITKARFTGKLPKGAKINTTGTGEIPEWRNGQDGVALLEKPLDVSTIKNVEDYIQTGNK